MDSTTNLFSRLDLADNFTSPCQKHADNKDTDLVEEGTASSFDPRMGPRRKKHNRHRRDSGPGPSGNGNFDTEHPLRQVRLVQPINDTHEIEGSLKNQDEILQCEHNGINEETFEKTPPYYSRCKGWWRKKEKEQIPLFDGGNSVLRPGDNRKKREGIVLSGNSIPHSGSWRNQGQWRWAHNGYVAPCYSAKNQIATVANGQGVSDCIDGATCSSFEKNNNKIKMKGADFPCASQPKTRHGHQRWSLPKAQDKNAANSCGLGMMVHGEFFDGNLSWEDIVRPDSEGRRPDKRKGKLILEDSTLSGGEDGKEEFHSDRLCSIEEMEVTGIVNDDNAFRSSKDVPWGRRDLTSKTNALPPKPSVCVSKREEGTSNHFSNPKHKYPMKVVHHFDDSLEIKDSHQSNPKAVLAPKDSYFGCRGNQRQRKFMKGKRKCNSICSNFCGSSSSSFEELETFGLQSTRHNPCTRSTLTCDSRHHDDIYDPFMELDELQSLELRHNNVQELSTKFPDHSNARVSQLESDEMLARELQEQFYDEAIGSAGTEEIDATIAWSLQQEETQQAAFAARSFQSDNREASMAHLYAYYAELPYRSSSARQSDRAHSQTSNRRRNYHSSEIDLETRLVAEARNFVGMDLQTRRNFLEELEAAFDHSNAAFGSHDDFNENDYEMLLALDENIHQHVGASESRINRLPQSVIQRDNVEEACAICLENPSTGDVIRHLPCLHKFHKECVDTWLRRRTWCPVCKSEIA